MLVLPLLLVYNGHGEPPKPAEYLHDDGQAPGVAYSEPRVVERPGDGGPREPRVVVAQVVAEGAEVPRRGGRGRGGLRDEGRGGPEEKWISVLELWCHWSVCRGKKELVFCVCVEKLFKIVSF
mgnify:CR=1 FL=1